MRLLFTTFPSPSHLYPMVPAMWACRAAGHEVLVASTTELVPAMRGTGIAMAETGRDRDHTETIHNPRLAGWHEQSRWPEDWPLRPGELDADQLALLANLGRRQVLTAESMLHGLLGVARDFRPDVVVHDAVSYAGPVVAAVRGVPNISHLWGSPGLQRLEMAELGDKPEDSYVALFDRYDVAVRTWPTGWLDPCPAPLALPVDAAGHLQVRYVPYNGNGVLPAGLAAHHPRRVCVTWGATTAKLMGGAMAGLFRMSVDAAVAVPGTEVVVATTAEQRALLGDLPDGVRVLESVPLHQLLPSCAAIVHHGGAGSTMTAAVHGCPQLIITRRPEPTLNGSRLARTGAGRHLTYDEVPDGPAGTELLRDHIAALLGTSGHLAAARDLAAAIAAQPSPAAVVPALEELVERYSPSGGSR
ncbi:glycosyltransferase [Micromonospora sp. PTRAS2]